MSLISPLMDSNRLSLGKTLLWKGGVAIATVAAVGLSFVSPTVAQTASEADPLEDFQTQDGSGDILSGGTQQGIQDLIHQLNLSVDLSMEDFAVQRHENILSEADRFRELQRARIDQEQDGVDDLANTESLEPVDVP